MTVPGPLRVAVPGPLRVLVRGATYRRGVYLLLGGVLLLPYALLAWAFVGMFSRGSGQPAVAVLLLLVTLVIAGLPAFLRGTRALEIAAVRLLLGVDLPDPPATAEPARAARETRLRSALWFAVHLVVGGVVGFGLLIALPMALVFIAQQFGVGEEVLAGLRVGPLDEEDTVGLTVVGVGLLVFIAYAVAGLGALAAVMAPVLLGPSATERIATLEAQATRLAERNRLARDLHDSVGHALTVTTLQAAAARSVLDTDPAFARRALLAIEDVGRGAMADLDHVLGVLRADVPGSGEGPRTSVPVRPRAPERTLADVGQLVAEARTAGIDLSADLSGPLADVPDAVGREGYRIVQESLTNALRHGGPAAVTLRLSVADGWLDIDVTNPVRSEQVAPGRDGGGRGLAGMAERVSLLGGSLSAGPDGGCWRTAARLPAAIGRAGAAGADGRLRS